MTMFSEKECKNYKICFWCSCVVFVLGLGMLSTGIWLVIDKCPNIEGFFPPEIKNCTTTSFRVQSSSLVTEGYVAFKMENKFYPEELTFSCKHLEDNCFFKNDAIFNSSTPWPCFVKGERRPVLNGVPDTEACMAGKIIIAFGSLITAFFCLICMCLLFA